MFKLRVFGGAALDGPAGLLSGPVVQRRQLALVAFLALHGPRPVSRDKVLAHLWTDARTERARRSLADAVYIVRRAMGDAAIASVGDELVLNAGLVWSDVGSFNDAIANDDPASAAALYTGRVLDGFHMPGASEFEHWLDLQRTRYSRLYISALESLASSFEASSEWADAAARWRQAAIEDPASTRLAIGLMRALINAGDRASALQHFQIHKSYLRQEFELEPGSELVALAAELQTVSHAPHASPARTVLLRSRAEKRDVVEIVTMAPAAPQPAIQTTPAPPSQDGGPTLPHVEGPKATSIGKFSFAAAAAVVALALLGLATNGGLTRRQSMKLDINRVVVAPFENRTGDVSLDVVGFMAADAITRGLLRAGLVDVVVPIDDPAAFRAPGRSERSYSVPPAELAMDAHAGTVIHGAFYLRGDSLQIQAQVLDAAGGRVEAVIEPVYSLRSSPQTAFERLRFRILGEIKARRQLGGFNPIRDMGYRPPDAQAYEAYWAGMNSFFRYDMIDAAERLQSAYQIDTTFLASLIFAGVAFLNRGQAAPADSLAQILISRADRLTRAEVIQAEWLHASARGDQSGAFNFAQQLAELLPRSPWKYQAARNAVAMHRPTLALQHLAALDSTRGWLPDWAGYWQVHAGAYHALGQHDRELAILMQGRRRARHSQPLRLLLYQARALGALGRVNDLHALVDEAISIGPHPGYSPAGIARAAALELLAHGHGVAANAFFERATNWYLMRPTEELNTFAFSLAETLYYAGRHQLARTSLDRLVASQPNSVNVRGLSGVLAARLGDHETARATDAWLARTASTNPGPRRNRLLWRARIAAQLADPTRAMELLNAAAALGRFDIHLETDFRPLRDQPSFAALGAPDG